MDPIAELPAEPETDFPPKNPPKLDLSQLDPPANLEDCGVEEITIDGICGVY